MGDSSSSSSRASTPTARWGAERIETLAHILTHQTLAPSLHSQLFVSLRVPCFVGWDWAFPPFLCSSRNSLPLWSLSLFLSRASRLGLPRTSWRCLCPFQQPPPCILSSAVDPAPDRWGPLECRLYARKRLRRSRCFGLRVPELLCFTLPNLALLSLLLFSDPLWSGSNPPR